MDNDSMKKNNNLGDVEIRTMKDDLHDLENPNYKKESPLPENSVVSPPKTSPFVQPKTSFISAPKPSAVSTLKISPAPSSTSLPSASESPFFNQKSWGKKEEKRKEDIYLPAKDEKDEARKSGMGVVIFSSVLISIILIAGVGAYYFWMTRMDKERSASIDLPLSSLNEENLTEDNVTQETQDIGEFSSESPNYLMLSDDQVTKESVAARLKEISEKIITSGAKTPLEFIVTDNKNNPLLFKVFAQMAGISLPPEVINNLDQDFSLYFFNEEGKMKLGMGIDSKNDIDLKVALLQEEKSLFSSLRMLYLDYVITEQEMTFSESIYLDQYVRYYNLDSTDKLSLDYTVYGEKGRLYFAISEKTLKAILDYAINK